MIKANWWEKLPEELKAYYRSQTENECDAQMLAFKKKHAHLKFGTDVTGMDWGEIKMNPPESGFVDEPEVYDDFAYARQPEPPKVIIAVNRDNEFVTGVAMLEPAESIDVQEEMVLVDE
jgi:hypothetical protein